MKTFFASSSSTLKRIALFTFIGTAFALAISSFTKKMNSTVAPDANRFSKVYLTEPGKLDEPMEMGFLPDGRILIVERKGGVKVFDTKTGTLKLVTTIPVNTKYKNKQGATREAEEGLMGVIAHPKFAENHWVYLYYADPSETKHVLARWEMSGDELIESSKKTVLEVPTQREECCQQSRQSRREPWFPAVGPRRF